MKPLLSMKSAQDLDRELQAAYHFAQDGLMEIASLRLWEQIKKVLETHAEKRGIKAQQLSVAAICGKGDNAGDALAVLRHARMEGYEKLHAVLPPSETLKENARLNYERGLQAGIPVS
jgi:NAD(P)H-hydrate repair Nnr-like enzyme with NAD(P)H-hydrate epimerase domain